MHIILLYLDRGLVDNYNSSTSRIGIFLHITFYLKNIPWIIIFKVCQLPSESQCYILNYISLLMLKLLSKITHILNCGCHKNAILRKVADSWKWFIILCINYMIMFVYWLLLIKWRFKVRFFILWFVHLI